MAAGYGQVGLLTVARRRLWLAVAALELPPDTPRSWAREGRSARRRRWPVMMGLTIVGWPARTVAFVLRCAFGSMRTAMRLVRTVHTIWP